MESKEEQYLRIVGKYKEIRDYIEKETDCSIVTSQEEYIEIHKGTIYASRRLIEIRCSCGDIFRRDFSSFKNRKNRNICSKCSISLYSKHAKDRKEKEAYIKKELELKGFIVSGEYQDTHTNLNLECKKCGHHFQRTYSTFKGTKKRKGYQTCPRCEGHIRKYTTKQVKDDFLEHGIELLSSEYENQFTPLKVRYLKCGHEAERTRCSIISSKYECAKCKYAGYNRDETQAKEEIKEKVGDEYTLVSPFVNTISKVKMRHNTCGNVYDVTFHKFINGGRRCPLCSSSKCEKIIDGILKENNVDFISEKTFPGLVSQNNASLRYDFAIYSEGKLAFILEYDGELHFKKYYEQQNFEIQQIHDAMKNEYCKDNEIPLVRIPYWKKEELNEIILNLLLEYKVIKKTNKDS